jgi:sugar lactone lactonase YvrE
MPAPDRLGRLYRLDVDGTLTKVLEDIGCSNGMGFAPDRKQMYYTDTRRFEIYLFDYDQDSGEIANRRLFVRVPEGEGGPDGMTVDAEGYVWSARWGGGRLVRYAPNGAQVARIDFPARKVSSVTFGGPDYADMFVTTAGGDNKQEDGPGAGGLFRLHPGVGGVPEFYSRVGL